MTREPERAHDPTTWRQQRKKDRPGCAVPERCSWCNAPMPDGIRLTDADRRPMCIHCFDVLVADDAVA